MADQQPFDPNQSDTSGGIVRNVARTMASLFGVSPDRSANPATMPNNMERTLPPIRMQQITPMELRHLPGFGSTKETDKQGATMDTILATFGQSIHDSETKLQSIDSLKMLTPQIEKAIRIYTGSILAPNDLQVGRVNITVDVPEFDPAKNEALSKFLSKFFNDHYNLGKKLRPWVEDARFRHGSKAIMIYPRDSNIDFLNLLADDEYPQNKETVLKEEAERKENARRATAESYANQDASIGYESFTENLDASVESLTKIISNESFGAILDQLPDDVAEEAFAVETRKEYDAELKGVVGKLLADADQFVRISMYPKSIRSGDPSGISQKLTQELADSNFFGGTTNPIYNINEVPGQHPFDYAAVTEQAPECVIPVIIPGSPGEHLGYFVVVGENSVPLPTLNSPSAWQDRTMTSAARAYYGNNNTPYLSKLTHDSAYSSLSKIFGLTVKTLLKSKLENRGILESDIQKYEAVTNCLFRHLLMRKRIGLVFVPEPIMVYYRYDHRPNGSGKSALEDLYSVISLRSTLMVAMTLAAVRDSIDKKRITINVDDKNLNPEQLCAIVADIWTNRNAYKFDPDPTRIGRELASKSLQIIPTGVRGLPESLKVEQEDLKSNRTYPPKEFLEELTQMVVDGLGVPPSAMNQTNADDYAISVATNNIYFSDDVRQLQDVTVRYTNKFLRLYLKYSPGLQRQIYQLLHPKPIDPKKEAAVASGQVHPGVPMVSGDAADNSMTNVSPTKDKNVAYNVFMADLAKIMNNMTITLPTPNVSTNKSHFKEIEEYGKFLDTVLNTIYPTDVYIGDSGSKYADSIKAIRALVKAAQLRKFITRLGMFTDMEIPELDEINSDEIKKFTQLAMNILKQINNMKVLEAQETPPEGDGSGTPSLAPESSTGASINPSELEMPRF